MCDQFISVRLSMSINFPNIFIYFRLILSTIKQYLYGQLTYNFHGFVEKTRLYVRSSHNLKRGILTPKKVRWLLIIKMTSKDNSGACQGESKVVHL